MTHNRMLAIRLLHLAHGSDEVHRNQIAKLELRKYQEHVPHTRKV
jgi:hypothetical protein